MTTTPDPASAGIPADGHYGPQTKQAFEQKIASG